MRGPVREHTWCSPASNKMNRAILAARQFQVEEKSFSAPSLGRCKGAACPCFAVVAIHNAVNERAWREILRWEAAHGGTPPRLVRFRCGSGRAVPGLPPGKCLGGVGWSLARGCEAVVGRKAVDKLWGWAAGRGRGIYTAGAVGGSRHDMNAPAASVLSVILCSIASPCWERRPSVQLNTPLLSFLPSPK